MKYIYLDTSSINYLNDNLRHDEMTKWKKLIESQFDGQIVFSPISLFEILNSNTERKDELIYTCQLLFDERLLPVPSTILDKYVAQGCPLVEIGKLDFDSWNLLNGVWRDVAGDLEKTILVENIRNTYEYSKMLKALINGTLCNYNNETGIAINEFIDSISPIMEVENDFEKVSLFFIIIILLVGALPFDSAGEFWHKRDISCMTGKFEYIAKHCKPLLYRGPIAAMAMMAIHQVQSGKSTRGLFNDCLHLGYTAYCSTMISNDEHFMQVSEKIKQYINCEFVSIKMRTQ